MIRNVAELLKEFVDRERKVLDSYPLAHGPTIGSMYEGLTREALEQGIPKEIGLQVVSGFAFFGSHLSGEIDCMVVRGSGERVPYTSKYKWHISDVIAVLEIKKTLSAEEIADSYEHLRGVSTMYSQYIDSDEAIGLKVDLAWPRRIFSQTTGVVAPDHKDVQGLPYNLEMIYHTLVSEYLCPVRIVMGHHGWKKEKTLRDHIAKLLQERLANPRGMGAGSFPQLIIGGEFSVVKMNGLPYVGPLIDGTWPFMASTSHNPLRVLLELLFTKLDSTMGTNLASDDFNDQEAMSSCLRAKAVNLGGVQGWEYQYDELSHATLRDRGGSMHWEPSELTSSQFVIINRLCADGHIQIDDPDFVAFASKEPGGQGGFVESLLGSHLVALDGSSLRLTTISCTAMITPDGKYVAGENNAGQMQVWLAHKLGKPVEEFTTLVLKGSEPRP